jgi:xanthine dehydrogenase accessory factor
VPQPDPLVETGEPVERLELDAYREFVGLAEEGRPVALVTVVGTDGSAPRGMGAAMAVREDGTIAGTIGGGDLEHLVVRHALDSLADGRPRRLHYDFSGGAGQNLEKACAGKADFYVQPCLVPPRLHVFGGGHIGIALAPIAEAAGFRVTVIDDRPGFPDPARFPGTVRLVRGALPEAVDPLPFDASTFVVIVTHAHEKDEVVLAACLGRPWRYLGMIGSRAKVARLFRSLGTDEASRKRLEEVRAPIGLDVGGRSPGEIAVSIAAELLAVRYGRGEVMTMRERVLPKPAGG